MVYVLVLEEFQREFAAAQLQAAVARGMGATGEMPSWAQARAEFVAFLVSEPEPVDWERETHMLALGMR